VPCLWHPIWERAPAAASLRRALTQVSDLAKTVRSADIHHVETSGLTIRESPAGNIYDWSYRSNHDRPNVWTVPAAEER
jgi:hypothetical protein